MKILVIPGLTLQEVTAEDIHRMEAAAGSGAEIVVTHHKDAINHVTDAEVIVHSGREFTFYATDQAEIGLIAIEKRRVASRQTHKAKSIQCRYGYMIKWSVEETIATIGFRIAHMRVYLTFACGRESGIQEETSAVSVRATPALQKWCIAKRSIRSNLR